MAEINPEALEQVVHTLNALELGLLDPRLFRAIARVFVSPNIELVPIKKGSRDPVEVLLARRAADDPFWPNMWANAGTNLRATDRVGTYDDAFQRLYDEDLDGLVPDQEPTFADNLSFRSERGVQDAKVYWLVVEQPRHGTFFAADNLPADTVDCQRGVIDLAVRHFMSSGG